MRLLLCCCALGALLAPPAAAEFLVQEGDYYPELTGLGGEPIRITGGRVDRITVPGGGLTIEGGSIGEILDHGGAPLVLRTGSFQLDTQPVDFFDVPILVFDGVYSLGSSGVLDGPNGELRIDYSGWFSDFTYGEFSVLFDSLSRAPDLTVNYLDRFPGDGNGDGVVDLTDLNNLRNYFNDPTNTNPGCDTNGDGMCDLEDLNNIRNNFGTDYRNPSPVPEPATLTLPLVGMMAMFLRRSWRRTASQAWRRARV